MALGNYNNNDDKKFFEPVVYSPYNTSNTDGVDPSALSFQFFRGLLKISISPMKPNAKQGDQSIWDHENAAAVYLTHTKARILADEVRAVMATDSINNSGVPTGSEGLISFSNGKELGATSPCLIIRKINNETGEVISSYAYQFKTTHYSIRNFNPSTSKYDTMYHENLEINQFLTILDEYATAISGAQAYSTLYAFKYEIQKNKTKMELIMDKLGIESPQYGNSNSGGGTSYFNQQHSAAASSSNTTMREATFDSLESGLS